MIIEKLIVGDMDSNCYVVGDEDTKDAIVIDPGGSAEKILNYIENNNLNLKYIVNTHGHIDHIAVNEKIINETGVELLIHKDDADFLKNGELNLSRFVGEKQDISPNADRLLEEGSKINFGRVDLKVLHTPGHTAGSICLLGANSLFSGDTLFSRGVGRTDLPTGSRAKLNKSLAKLSKLDKNLKVYPGHGPADTLADIRKNNPYI